MIKVMRRCLRALDIWRKPWFLSQGPVLGAPCHHVTLATDASMTGSVAVMSGHPAHGLWSSRHLAWHINFPEMLAMFRALKHFLPDLRDRHVLYAQTIQHIDFLYQPPGLHSLPLYKLTHRILVSIFLGMSIWEQTSCRCRGRGPGNGCFHSTIKTFFHRIA